jgi:isopentenyl phosphate kinase
MICLKLGGSLITAKDQPQVARVEKIRGIAEEIAHFWSQSSEKKLIVGHGSGSFGHHAAARYGTQRGASSHEDFLGFAEVWATANRLNRIVVDAFLEEGLPLISFSPSASAVSESGAIRNLATEPIQRALLHGLLPLVHGDVAFDRRQGTAILSTESIFGYLAPVMRPDLVLLAGQEKGVYADYPECERLIPLITNENAPQLGLQPSTEVDVTGGMADKVWQALHLCEQVPGVRVRIFSGEPSGSIRRALEGESLGTLIHAS